MANAQKIDIPQATLGLINHLIPPGIIDSLTNEDFDTTIERLRNENVPLPTEVTRQQLRGYLLKFLLSRTYPIAEGNSGPEEPLSKHLRAIQYSVDKLSADEGDSYQKLLSWTRKISNEYVAAQQRNRLYLLSQRETARVVERVIKHLPKHTLEDSTAVANAIQVGIAQETGHKLRELGRETSGEGEERVTRVRERVQRLTTNPEDVEIITRELVQVTPQQQTPAEIRREEERLGDIAWKGQQFSPFAPGRENIQINDAEMQEDRLGIQGAQRQEPRTETTIGVSTGVLILTREIEEDRARVVDSLLKVEKDTAVVEYAENMLKQAQRGSAPVEREPELVVRSAALMIEEFPREPLNSLSFFDAAEKQAKAATVFGDTTPFIDGHAVDLNLSSVQKAAAVTVLGGVLFQRTGDSQTTKAGIAALTESAALNEILREFHSADVQAYLDAQIARGVNSDVITGLKDWIQKSSRTTGHGGGIGMGGKVISDAIGSVARSSVSGAHTDPALSEQAWEVAGTFHSMSELFAQAGKKPAFLKNFFDKTGLPAPKTMDEKMAFLALISRDPDNFSVPKELLGNDYFKQFIAAAKERNLIVGNRFSPQFRGQIATILYHIDITYLMMTNPAAAEQFRLQRSQVAEGPSFVLSYGGQIAQRVIGSSVRSGVASVARGIGLRSVSGLISGLATGGTGFLVSAGASLLGGGLSFAKNLLSGRYFTGEASLQNNGCGCLLIGGFIILLLFGGITGIAVLNKNLSIANSLGSGGYVGVDVGGIDCTNPANASSPLCQARPCLPGSDACQNPLQDCAAACISQFPDPWSGGSHRRFREDAVDFGRCPTGTPIRATFSGTIITAGPTDWGLTVIIQVDGDDSFRPLFAHLQRVSVSVGQHVTAGDVIGTQDTTGPYAGGVTHLHYEIMHASNGYRSGMADASYSNNIITKMPQMPVCNGGGARPPGY